MPWLVEEVRRWLSLEERFCCSPWNPWMWSRGRGGWSAGRRTSQSPFAPPHHFLDCRERERGVEGLKLVMELGVCRNLWELSGASEPPKAYWAERSSVSLSRCYYLWPFVFTRVVGSVSISAGFCSEHICISCDKLLWQQFNEKPHLVPLTSLASWSIDHRKLAFLCEEHIKMKHCSS